MKGMTPEQQYLCVMWIHKTNWLSLFYNYLFTIYHLLLLNDYHYKCEVSLR